MPRRNRVLFSGWPSWRYSPTGEGVIFTCEEDVPLGWAKKMPEPREVFYRQPTESLDREELLIKLTELGVTINHTWGNAHMKRIIDGDISSTR